REANPQQWDEVAETWARAAEEEEKGASADAAKWMLEAADLRPGERVLEIACGAGRVGLQAASRVGPEGTVLCSDFSEAMVAAVGQRVDRLGIANVEARVLDAEDIDLDEQPFDVVLCRFGYMVMPDAAQALRESARALRPGGRLVLAVWGEAEKNLWLAAILNAVMSQLGAPPPEPGAPGPFSLGDPARLRELLDQAGLAEAEITELETKQRYDSPEAWWDKILDVGGPLAAILSPLSEADRQAIRDAALAVGREYVTADGSVVFPASVVGAEARKPGQRRPS
ncbi:MAG TPA: class I SAM-dependent methyltransferase, partial [Solirubrobacterales bacterium]|nr:class I SAM-dependent methyltransferase [Solirubrobacterales bacterium]